MLTLDVPTGLSKKQPQAISRNVTRTSVEIDAMSALGLVHWSVDRFGDGLVMTTSFGIQSAVMLHLASRVRPEIPVIWVDTGYLPPETYRFAEELTDRLNLNLHVVQSRISPARMEATLGRLWESDDVDELNLYDRIRKVAPLREALVRLRATAWLAGLRATQTSFRKSLDRVSFDAGRAKILPILYWSSAQMHLYLKKNNLPYHPLFEEGYMTVGDAHSSRPVTAEDGSERDTRFQGRKQECGIHLPGAMR